MVLSRLGDEEKALGQLVGIGGAKDIRKLFRSMKKGDGAEEDS